MNSTLECFTDIEQYLQYAPQVNDLGANPFPKDLYAAYLRVCLTQGDTLNKDIDKRVALSMIRNKVPVRDIVEALSFSNNFSPYDETDIETFLAGFIDQETMDEYKINKYLLKIFKLNNFDNLADEHSYYINAARRVLKVGDELTLAIDEQIIKLLLIELQPLITLIGTPRKEVIKIVRYSPNFQNLSNTEIQDNFQKIWMSRDRKMSLLFLLIGAITMIITMIIGFSSVVLTFVSFLTGFYYYRKATLKLKSEVVPMP